VLLEEPSKSRIQLGSEKMKGFLNKVQGKTPAKAAETPSSEGKVARGGENVTPAPRGKDIRR
jgi:hypothetical protein